MAGTTEETWNGKPREQFHAELDQALDAEKERWTAEQAEAPPSSRDTMADAGSSPSGGNKLRITN